MKKKIKVTLVKSAIGRIKSHKSCIIGLGLKKINHSVVVDDTPQNRGMINAIGYIVKYEVL